MGEHVLWWVIAGLFLLVALASVLGLRAYRLLTALRADLKRLDDKSKRIVEAVAASADAAAAASPAGPDPNATETPSQVLRRMMTAPDAEGPPDAAAAAGGAATGGAAATLTGPWDLAYTPPPGKGEQSPDPGKVVAPPILRFRFWSGIAYQVVAVVLMVTFTWLATRFFEALHNDHPTDKLDLIWKIAILVARTGFTVAFLLLGFAFIRAGDRMFLPTSLLDAAKDAPAAVDAIRALQGRESPLRASKAVTEAAEAMAKAAPNGEQMVKIVEAVAKAMKS